MAGIGRTEKFDYSQNDWLLCFALQPVAKNHVNFLLLTQSELSSLRDVPDEFAVHLNSRLGSPRSYRCVPKISPIRKSE